MTKTAREILTEVLKTGATYGRDGRYFAGKSDIDQALKELEAIHQQEIAKARIDGAESYKNSLQNEMVDHQDNLVGFKEMDSWFEQYKLSQTLKEPQAEL